MRDIVHSNRSIALRVLVSAFSANPAVLWVARQDAHIQQRLRSLCAFCLDMSMEKKGAFISDDEKGVVLLFPNNARVPLYHSIPAYYKLGRDCIGWDRALSVILRERTIRQHRPKIPHLYCWMLAVEDRTHGLHTIIALRDHIFRISAETQLPVLAETTVPSLLILYQRYGFHIYNTWEPGHGQPTVYFIRRDPDQ